MLNLIKSLIVFALFTMGLLLFLAMPLMVFGLIASFIFWNPVHILWCAAGLTFAWVSFQFFVLGVAVLNMRRDLPRW